jgi:hypothetical protein
MHQQRPLSFAEYGVFRVLVLYYPSLLLAYPLVVMLLGHSQQEGLAFLSAHKGLVSGFLAFPLVFGPLSYANYRLDLWWRARCAREEQGRSDPPKAA